MRHWAGGKHQDCSTVDDCNPSGPCHFCNDLCDDDDAATHSCQWHKQMHDASRKFHFSVLREHASVERVRLLNDPGDAFAVHNEEIWTVTFPFNSRWICAVRERVLSIILNGTHINRICILYVRTDCWRGEVSWACCCDGDLKHIRCHSLKFFFVARLARGARSPAVCQHFLPAPTVTLFVYFILLL